MSCQERPPATASHATLWCAGAGRSCSLNSQELGEPLVKLLIVWNPLWLQYVHPGSWQALLRTSSSPAVGGPPARPGAHPSPETCSLVGRLRDSELDVLVNVSAFLENSLN